MKNRNFYESLFCALRGIIFAIKKEKHMRIHLLFTIFVIVLGYLFNISDLSWILVGTAICFVLSSELVNTAFELLVDFVHGEHHPEIMVMKDISAAGVLFSAIFSLFVFYYVFGTKLILLILSFLKGVL